MVLVVTTRASVFKVVLLYLFDECLSFGLVTDYLLDRVVVVVR